MTEIWKPLRRYPGYEISNLGELRHASGRPVPRKMLKFGYTQVYLESRFESRQQMLHTLLLETFVGPRPPGAVVCHINDIPDDNRLENLCYGTSLTNAAHRIENQKSYPLEQWAGAPHGYVSLRPRSVRKSIKCIETRKLLSSGRFGYERKYVWGELPVARGYVHRPLVKHVPGMGPGWCE